MAALPEASTLSTHWIAATGHLFQWRLIGEKAVSILDLKTRQVKRKGKAQIIDACIPYAVKFRFILMDSWFSSEENFDFITNSKQAHFFMSICATFKLKCLSIKNTPNPFALCRKRDSSTHRVPPMLNFSNFGRLRNIRC